MKFIFLCWGGGQLAVSNAAFFSACDDLCIRPSVVYASSGGTFAASQRYVMGHKGEDLKRIGVEFDLLGMGKLANLLGNQHSFIDEQSFRKNLSRYLTLGLQLEEFNRKSEVDFQMIASTKRYGVNRPVLIDRGDMITAMEASCAFPGLIPAVTFYQLRKSAQDGKQPNLISAAELMTLSPETAKLYKPVTLRDGDLSRTRDVIREIYPRKKPADHVVFSVFHDSRRSSHVFSNILSRLIPSSTLYSRKVNFNFPYSTSLTPLCNDDELLSQLYDSCYEQYKLSLENILANYHPGNVGVLARPLV